MIGIIDCNQSNLWRTDDEQYRMAGNTGFDAACLVAEFLLSGNLFRARVLKSSGGDLASTRRKIPPREADFFRPRFRHKKTQNFRFILHSKIAKAVCFLHNPDRKGDGLPGIVQGESS